MGFRPLAPLRVGAATVVAVVFALFACGPAQAAWGPVSTVSPEGLDVEAAQGAVTSDGTQVLELASPNPDGSQRVGLLAVPKGSPVRASTVTLADRGELANVAVDAQGNALAAWADGQGVRLAWRAPNGSLTDEPTYYGWDPHVAMNENGDAAAVWDTSGPNDGAVIQLAGHSHGDASFGAAVDLSTEGAPYRGRSANVAMTTGGDAVAVWWSNDDGHLQYRIRQPDGTLSDTTTLSDGSVRDVRVLAAGSRVLVVWRELPGASDYAGPLMSAIVAPDAPPIVQVLSAPGDSLYQPAVVAASDNGRVLVAWEEGYTHDNGWSPRRTYILEGDLADGALTGPAQPLNDEFGATWDVPLMAALAADGRAIVAFPGEVAVRLPGGVFTERPAPGCSIYDFPVLLGFEDDHSLMLWGETQTRASARPLFVARDGAAVAPACTPQTLVVSPNPTFVNQPVTIDASNYTDPEALETEWAWDLDNDGTIDVDFSDQPKLTHTFDTMGEHVVGLTVRYRTAHGDEELEQSISIDVEDPDAVYKLLLAHPSDYQWVAPPGSDGAATAPAGIVSAPRTTTWAAITRRGVRIRVSSNRSGQASLALDARSRTLARARSIVAANRPTAIVLKPKVSTSLRRRRNVRLTVRVRLPGGGSLKRSVTVRR